MYALKRIFKGKDKEQEHQTTNDVKTVDVGGNKKPTSYKLNGEKVVLLHNNKKIQRSIYIKGKTKYCKINNLTKD